jgi:hypothetical protein
LSNSVFHKIHKNDQKKEERSRAWERKANKILVGTLARKIIRII